MCGITGAYFRDSSKEINRSVFELSCKSIAHRGPDNGGTWINGGIALGHNRLSILDVSTASNQPFFSGDNRFAIIFNGEIFNYAQLKKQLENEGERFSTSSDTEVLLRLLMKKGIDCLNELNGFFAFAFYDKQKHELWVVRDRFGEKPVFYAGSHEAFYFGSELKAVVPFIDKPEPDFTALELLLHLTYIPAPFTIVKDVKKLEPGHFLHISEKGIEYKRWYALHPVASTQKNEQEIFDQLRSKFETAVERRMISDVPVAGFLSGGIDSTLVSATAKKINPSFETFSLGFSENKFIDETKDAGYAAEKAGISHHAVKLSEEELLSNVFEILQKSDEPFGDSSMIALYSLCKKIRGKYKVILSGDGADEVFAGYNKHYALYQASKKSTRNRLIKYTGGVHAALPKSRNNSLSNKFRQLEKMHAVLNKNEFERYWYLAGFNTKTADKLLNKKQGYTAFFNRLKDENPFEGINKILFYDVQLVLPNDMLYKVDLASMYNAIEIRSPFMDNELIEYAFSLPGELKIKKGVKKYLLKHAFPGILDDYIIKKPKHGFEVPLQQWLTGPLKTQVENKLNEHFIKEQRIFDPGKINALVKKLNSKNPGDAASTIWTLLNFQASWENLFNA